MKNLIYTLIIAGVALLTSCEEERNIPEFNQRIQEGQWRVTEIQHPDTYGNDLFKNYAIAFSEQNTITAVGINFYRGWWEMREENGPVLEIKFATEYEVPMVRLNGIWKLTEYNDQLIKMNYPNPNTGTTDNITLEKI